VRRTTSRSGGEDGVAVPGAHVRWMAALQPQALREVGRCSGRTQEVAKEEPGRSETPSRLRPEDRKRGTWSAGMRVPSSPTPRCGTNCDGGEVSGRRYKGAAREGWCDAATWVGPALAEATAAAAAAAAAWGRRPPARPP
jgi:hypothetical protein